MILNSALTLFALIAFLQAAIIADFVLPTGNGRGREKVDGLE